MGFDEVLTSVLSTMPMMAGIILTVIVLKLDLDHERDSRKSENAAYCTKEEAAIRRYDELHAKMVEIALNCHDESIKTEAINWKPSS